MTVSSGFFNSVNHDRLYDAEQLSSIFDGIIIDGVYENYGEAFMVTANPDANSSVIIGTGRAWFDHTWTVNDSQFAMQLDPPNELLGRTDAIVLDIDRSQETRKNSIIYIKGSESSPELPPSFIDEDLHKQYPIAYISRPAGPNSVVNQQNITITVGTSVCPVVTGILDAQNLENLWQQLDDEFNTWWDGIKDTLDENTVTNLQNQINELKDKIDSDNALVGLLEKPIAESFKNANFNIDIKSYSFSYSPPIDTGVPNADRQGNNIFDYYPLCGLLPDGYIFCIARSTYQSSYGSGDTLIQLVCQLVNTDGVSTYNRFDLFGGDAGTETDPYEFRNAKLIYTHGQYDTFPVEINFVLYTSYSSASFTHKAWSYKVTITSQHSVVFTKIGEVGPVDSELVMYGDSVHCYVGNLVASETSEAYLFGYSYYSGRGVGARPESGERATYGWTGKVMPNGVLTAPVRTNNAYPTLYSYPYNGSLVYCDDIESSNSYAVVMSGSSDNWVKVDIGSLVATVGSGNVSSDITDIKTRFPVKSYNLSEVNGVQVTEYEVGKSQTSSINKKDRLYFIGGDNLGNGLIEGTYTCRNDSNRLYGVGPNGEQIAIGTNGGAAILKTKKSVSSSIDLSKIQKTLPGQVNVPDVGSFYLILNTRNAENISSLSGSVICILEE